MKAERVAELEIQGILLAEGSRIEWDVIGGIGIPGAGTCTGITSDGCGDVGTVMIYMDPNEGLRAMAAEMRAHYAALPVPGWHYDTPQITRSAPIKTGLDGEGGFLVLTGDGIKWGLGSGKMRVLPERRAPETWAAALEEEKREIAERAKACGFCVFPTSKKVEP